MANKEKKKETPPAEMLKAVKEYIAKGWVIHPLAPPDDKGTSPGKRPLLMEWQKLTKTPEDTGRYIRDGCNLGLVCGKASGVTVIDFDHTLFWTPIAHEIFTLSAQRTEGRGHVYFKYNPDLPSQKHHLLGIEVLGDGSNVVLPPSKHASGDTYNWVNPDAPLASMPQIFLERLNILFTTEANLIQYMGECRPCFKKLWNSGKPDALHGADGRECMLAWATELKAKDAGLDETLMLARLVYKNEFSSKETAQEWKNTKSKPWTCKKIKERLSSIISCVECPIEKKHHGKNREEKEEIFEMSFTLLKDGRIAEEVYNSDGAKFAVWDGNNVEYLEEIKKGVVVKPLVNDAIFTGAVKLPSEAKGYGTLQELLDSIQNHVHKYLDISEDMEVFASWYILLSWVYDRVNTLPYLRALGDSGTGKSRTLDVIGGLCYKACIVSGAITPAPIYRMIRQWGGTIVLDEADFRDSSEKSEVITILNCGFEKNRPVIRCDQNNVDTLLFLPTYCPKVIATRYTFNDKALESRCLTEKMTQTNRKDIPRVLPAAFYEEQQQLRNKLLMFRFKHYWLVDGNAGQELDLGDIEPRLHQATQSFAALFAKIPELMIRFKKFLEKYNKELIEDRSESFDGMIVHALLKLKYEDDKQDISSKDIAKKMIEDFGLEKVTPQAVGKHLKSLKIETKQKAGGGARFVVWDNTHIVKLKRRYVPAEGLSPYTNGFNGTNATDSVLSGTLSKNAAQTVPSVPFVPSIIGESPNMVQSLDKVEQAGREWERIKGTSINSLNLTDFCLWYCENKDKNRQPSEIRAIAEKVFKITPEPQYIKIRFLKDIPKFVGYDGKDYGAFKSGDIDTIPLVNAQALITRQAAEKVAG